MSQPTRVGLTIGSTTRLNEYDFAKISLSLERDLVPAESPIDAYRDIRALLEKMLLEFQQPGSKSGQPGPTQPGLAKSQQNGTVPPGGAGQKPAGLLLETVRKVLGPDVEKVQIAGSLDGSITVTPKHYLLQETWHTIDEALRPLDAKWRPAVKGIGSWIVPA